MINLRNYFFILVLTSIAFISGCKSISKVKLNFEGVTKLDTGFIVDSVKIVQLSFTPVDENSKQSYSYIVYEDGVRIGYVRVEYASVSTQGELAEYSVSTFRGTSGDWLNKQVSSALKNELLPSTVKVDWILDTEKSGTFETVYTPIIKEFQLYFPKGVSYSYKQGD